jgi:TPR repeat protein
MHEVRLVGALSLSVAMSVANADVDKARAALQRGDYSTAIAEFRSSAEIGESSAQTELGGMYLEGKGVAKNEVLRPSKSEADRRSGDPVFLGAFIGTAPFAARDAAQAR